MRKFKLGLISSVFLTAASPLAAQVACPVHEVVAGDSLGDIALAYYGVRGEAFRIYDANRDVIGPDIDLIERGQVLMLPCEGGRPLIAMPEASSDVGDETQMAMAEGETKAGQAAAKPNVDTPLMAADEATPGMEMAEPIMMFMPDTGFHVLTGGPFAPFAGEHLPGGGMMVELVEAALATAGEPVPEMAFVNDRAAHLGLILPRGGFGLALPWIYPDCSSDQGQAAREICETFIASNGFYEFVTEFYARADGEKASVTLWEELADTRLCRPVGYPVDDLERAGLLPDSLVLVTLATPADCLRALDTGDVDIASMDAAVTRGLIDRIEIENPIVVLENLTQLDKLRVLALRADPEAPGRIERLNAALEEMSSDGRWFEIVSRHLRSVPQE